MSISDRTRKILWAKSGNRCAICRCKLVIERSFVDNESLVGDECHIISGAVDGPRYQTDCIDIEIDGVDNLLILCKVHHKMIDDQIETYSIVKLKNVKKLHEKWVEDNLSDLRHQNRAKIVRNENDIPKMLTHVISGKKLLEMASACESFYQDYPDDLNSDETEIVGFFIQELRDWADIGDMVEPIDYIRAGNSISEHINTLKESGFMVFGDVEKQKLVESNGLASRWNALHIWVLRDTDSRIIKKENVG
jgi:hypothetical protein